MSRTGGQFCRPVTGKQGPKRDRQQWLLPYLCHNFLLLIHSRSILSLSRFPTGRLRDIYNIYIPSVAGKSYGSAGSGQLMVEAYYIRPGVHISYTAVLHSGSLEIISYHQWSHERNRDIQQVLLYWHGSTILFSRSASRLCQSYSLFWMALRLTLESQLEPTQPSVSVSGPRRRSPVPTPLYEIWIGVDVDEQSTDDGG